MAIDNLPTNDESRRSGAYIRNLVKQLTSSKPTHTNEILITNDSIIVGEEYTPSIVSNKRSESFGMAKPKNQNTHQGHKKQVRRRLHTSRPYQERLLNMAEARKEIVTALKFHRATMKQANEKKHQQEQLEYHIPQQQSILGLQDFDARKPKIESQPCFTNTNAMMDNFSYYSLCNNNSYTWPLIEQLPLNESLNIPLPNQTLGLNLNLQAFANLDTNICNNINTPTSNFKYSSPPPMSPSSSSSSTPRDLIGTMSAEGVRPTYLLNQAIDMHPALDEEEMAKIRSIGEQHQIEWDDTLDLVKSAWWLKFLKSKNHSESCFEEFMEFPPWLSASDQCLLQQHLEESCSEGTSLPWVDIGDIDGMDDEWLS